jgi:hypothetical protein
MDIIYKKPDGIAVAIVTMSHRYRGPYGSGRHEMDFIYKIPE